MREQLKNRRKQLGLTQKEVAEKLEVRQATISDFEKGKHKMSAAIFGKYLDLLMLSPDQVFDAYNSEIRRELKEMDDRIKENARLINNMNVIIKKYDNEK